MESNIYQAPESEILNTESTAKEFYVVSPKKFLVLYFGTMGLYLLYWFYKHWALYKATHSEKMWPVMRSIFSIFFTHSLFEAFDLRVREVKSNFSWSPGGLATTFVILSIIDRISERMASNEVGSPLTDTMAFILMPMLGYVLYKAQLAANVGMGDHLGKANTYLTAANYVWLLIGGALWLIVILSLYMIIMGVPEFLQ